MPNALIRALTPEDEPALEEFLVPKLASSLFLVSNSRRVGIVDHGGRYHGTYVGAFEGPQIQAVGAHYWNGMLILQMPRFLEQVVVEAIRLSGRSLKGLIGPAEQVQKAKELLNLQQADYQIDEADGLYALRLTELVVPSQLKFGYAAGRRVSYKDLDQVSAWRTAYSVELLGVNEDQELRNQSRSNMAENIASGQSWVLESGGEMVANTSFNASVKEAVQVGGVYTPPELRGKGYGRSVVAASLLDARNEGAEMAFLFTGDSNSTARKAYAALGFERIGDYRLSILSEPVEKMDQSLMGTD